MGAVVMYGYCPTGNLDVEEMQCTIHGQYPPPLMYVCMYVCFSLVCVLFIFPSSHIFRSQRTTLTFSNPVRKREKRKTKDCCIKVGRGINVIFPFACSRKQRDEIRLGIDTQVSLYSPPLTNDLYQIEFFAVHSRSSLNNGRGPLQDLKILRIRTKQSRLAEIYFDARGVSACDSLYQ